jgi:hypothetical protein
MLRFLRALVARLKRPAAEYERDASDMAEAKRYAQARDWSPPPPGAGGSSGVV